MYFSGSFKEFLFQRRSRVPRTLIEAIETGAECLLNPIELAINWTNVPTTTEEGEQRRQRRPSTDHLLRGEEPTVKVNYSQSGSRCNDLGFCDVYKLEFTGFQCKWGNKWEESQLLGLNSCLCVWVYLCVCPEYNWWLIEGCAACFHCGGSGLNHKVSREHTVFAF